MSATAPTKPPSKRTQRAAEVAARKAERAAEKERIKVAKIAARERCRALSHKPPDEFQQRGFVRTRAWRNAAAVAARKARGTAGSLESIEAAAASVEYAMTAPIEKLAAAR